MADFIANPRVLVSDISRHQDDPNTPERVDFAKMRSSGLLGVILKAGQKDFIDRTFLYNVAECKRVRFNFGTYFYYDPTAHWRDQADLWASLVHQSSPNLDNWADIEYSWDGTYKGIDAIYNFMERAKSNGIPNLVIYTGYYWWYDNIWKNATPGQLNYFKQYPLSLAWYADSPDFVSIPQPWTEQEWRWWQFTERGDGHKYGVESSRIDLDKFNGTEDDFYTLFTEAERIELPPEGEPTMTYNVTGKVSATAGLRVRQQPNATATILGILPYQTPVQGILDGEWIKITYNGQVGYVSAQYVEILTSTPIEPSTGDINLNMVLRTDGTISGTWTRL